MRKVIDHLVWKIDHVADHARVGISISPTLIRPTTAAPRRIAAA